MKSTVRFGAALTAVTLALCTAPIAGAATAELFAETAVTASELAVDPAGDIFVSLSDQSTVRAIGKVTPAGVLNATWVSGLSDYPYTLALGAGGSIVAKVGNAKIQRFDATGASANTYSSISGLGGMTTDAAGNIWWTASFMTNSVGRIPVGTASGTPTGTTISEQPCGIATDAAGNAYVGAAGKVIKFDSSGSRVGGDFATVSGVGSSCDMAVDATYLYVTTSAGQTGGVARVALATGAVEATWASGMSPAPKRIAVGSDGKVYSANVAMGGPSPSTVSVIGSSGTATTLASLTFRPEDIALDAGTNVYLSNQGNSFPMTTPGVYKITQAAPTPAPSPAPAPSTTPTPAPAPGPEVKVTTVPKEIVVEIPSTPGAAPVAEVPCEAANGEKLQSCTVDMQAPTAALLGQGDGVIVEQARAARTFLAGKATVSAKGGKKRIVVPVKINAKGRTALQRNIRLKVMVGITTVTISGGKSSGDAETQMQLPKQILAPQDGIFATLSTKLNANGRKFVNRLAALLPTTPQEIVCTGYADNTGVPGDNRWLGDRRAKALCAALEAKGIEAKKVRTVSMGAAKPRDTNKTESGRAKNRRAEITITY